MTSDTKTKRARIVKRMTTWTLRIMVVVTILFFVAVLVSASMGGNGEIQRKSLETIIAGVFGRHVEIHQLNMYQVFPTQRVDFEHMVVGEEGESEPYAILGKILYVNDPIAGWMGGPPIKALSFANFMTRPGYFGPYSLHLREGQIMISANPGDKRADAELFMTGRYGKREIKVTMPMAASARGSDWSYRFVGDQPIIAENDGVRAEFQLQILEDKVLLEPLAIKLPHANYNGTMIVPYGKKRAEPTLIKLTNSSGDVIFDGPVKELIKQVRGEMKGKLDHDLLAALKPIFVQKISEHVP